MRRTNRTISLDNLIFPPFLLWPHSSLLSVLAAADLSTEYTDGRDSIYRLQLIWVASPPLL